MTVLCSSKFLNVFSHCFQNFSAVLGKNFSAQQCLLSLLEKWKSAIDNQKRFGALLTYLSKAFDCLSHDPLIAKLNACGFSIDSLRLVQDYLTNRKQRNRINSAYSSWE